MPSAVNRHASHLIGLFAVAAYVAAYLPLHAWLGPGVGALSAIPVCVVGALFGLRAGLVAGIASLPVNTLLVNAAGSPGWDAVVRAGGGPGSVALLLIGAATGYLRDIRTTLEQRSRQLALEHRRLQESEADLRRLRGALQASNLLIRSALAHAPVTFFAVDALATFTFGGGRRVDELGLVPGSLTGRSAFDAFAVCPAIGDAVAVALAGEERSVTVTAGDATLEMRCAPIRDPNGEISGAAGIIVDVTQRGRAVRALERQAGRDSVTGLPNRGLFLEQVERALSGGDAAFSLLLVDLDNLAALGESLGHQVSDAVLRAVAGRIGRRLRENDYLARLDSDVLALLLPGTDHSVAVGTCQALLETMHEPVVVDGSSFAVELSIGIAGYPGDARHASGLLRIADAAVAAAKRSGSGYASARSARVG